MTVEVSYIEDRVRSETPNVSTSTSVSKTFTPPMVVTAKEQNILNKYRSSTHIFTLAALRRNYLENPKLYRDSELDLVIIRSGGKGTGGIAFPNADAVTLAEKNYQAESVSQSATTESLARAKSRVDTAKKAFDQANNVIPGFNNKSPGRFDMFIQNVEINTMFGFKLESAASFPTTIKFEVIEPYSINGFIESLHVSAIAAGYPNYLQAPFMLKVEFIGYPDDKDLPSTELIPNSARYFPFMLTGVNVDVSEQGTKYTCTAVPVNERIAFGQSNKLKKPINMSGATVGEILKDLMRNVTQQQKEADKSSKESSATSSRFDEFEIKFPVWSSNGWDFSQENKIALSTLVTELKDNAIYKFPNPASQNTPANAYRPRGQRTPSPQQQSSQPNANRVTPGAGDTKPQIQFNENAVLTGIISAVIRDSEYTKNLIKNIESNVDQYGYVDYFLVRAEAVNKDTFDDVSRRHFQKITYIVSPYKIHYKRIPGFGANKVLESKLKVLAAREYNYMYTGKNIDVLTFKLNFNSLYFESVPVAMGNTDQPNKKAGVTPDGTSEVRLSNDNKADIQNDSMGTPPLYYDTQASAVQPYEGNASQRQDDPYSALARNMHNAIVNSKASMLSGDLEILGDPFYLVTGGMGNYNPASGSDIKQTKDGEANYIYREVLITINFRNPVDIGENGFHEFDPNRVPWSGVYRVNEVTHTFQNGVFKQVLKIMRMPGQILGDSNQETPIANKFKLRPKINDTPIAPTSIGVDVGRASGVNLLSQLSRGLPSPGLPGMLSNFTSAQGGLGGAVSGLLNQVSGAVSSGIGKLTSAASVFGGSVPGGVDQLASGIRLQSSGLVNLASQVLQPAALVGQVANSVETRFPVNNAASSLASNLISKASALVNSVSTPGSGIGEGATVFVNKISSGLPSTENISAFDVKSLTSQLPTGIASLSGMATNLSQFNLDAVKGLGSSAASLAGGINSKISSLTGGISTDPNSLASSFGINVSQLSGLGEGLKSKLLGQVSKIAETIPSKTNISQAVSEGLVLDYVAKDKFKNIPATNPYKISPEPDVNVLDLQSIASKGGPDAVARSFGVSDISKVSTSLLPKSDITDIFTSVGSSLKNPLSSLSKEFNITDSTLLGDRLTSARGALSGLAGNFGSVESNLNSVKSLVGNSPLTGNNLGLSVSSKFGSLTEEQSPLKKLFGNG